MKGISLAGAKVVVQGYGNAGSIVARLLHEDGARVIAVSDSRGGIFNAKGIDPVGALRQKERAGSLGGFPGSDPITNAELLELPCDVLVPAALQTQITEKNVGNVKARIVAEAANGPTTPAADRVLAEKGVFLIPDILANAGGVSVSYFEWVQNLYGFSWGEKEVNAHLEQTLINAFHEVHAASERHKVHMRTGAYVLAIGRVADATRVRGIFP